VTSGRPIIYLRGEVNPQGFSGIMRLLTIIGTGTMIAVMRSSRHFDAAGIDITIGASYTRQ
jgi:Na+-translocating ferredoxin:NAD+ oxidoreductase RnfG subunit